jgi:magnesium transporter
MARLLKSRRHKRGASPGTLVHIGERRSAATVVSLISFDQRSFDEQTVDLDDACVLLKGTEGISWLNVEGVTQVEVLKRVGDCYGLHPLVMEDIVNTDQRPKKEDYGEYLFIVAKMLDTNRIGKISAEQVSMILGDGWLLTFQEGLDGDPFEPVRERLRTAKGRLRGQGADYLAYALLDAIIDHYFAVLERLADRVEQLEEEVVASPTRRTILTIHNLKQEMILIRKSIWPLRELIGGLERRDSELIHEGTIIYLRDLYDHTVQIIDTVETLREMLSGMLDIYLSSEANRTNEVMKVLTVYATIFMPLTFIVGLYGMNFKFMPELEWHWGYPAVLVFMAALAGGMMLYFRREKWLGRNFR